jgi:hypothetical protein
VLNHISGSRVVIAGVYQRHDWAAEKRAALDTWVAVVEGRAAIPNVVMLVADQHSAGPEMMALRRFGNNPTRGPTRPFSSRLISFAKCDPAHTSQRPCYYRVMSGNGGADQMSAQPEPHGHKRTAVLVVHGMGSQRPLDTVRGVVEAVSLEGDLSARGERRIGTHPERSGVDGINLPRAYVRIRLRDTVSRYVSPVLSGLAASPVQKAGSARSPPNPRQVGWGVNVISVGLGRPPKRIASGRSPEPTNLWPMW